MAGAVFKAGGIAHGINGEVITGGQLGFGLEQFYELHERMDAFGFVTVKAGKDAEADRYITAARTDEQVARQFVTPAV